MKGQTLTVSSKQYQPVILRVFIIARVKKEAMDIWVWVPKFPFDFPILENIRKLSLALLVRCSYWFAEWDLSDCPRISLLDWISTRRKKLLDKYKEEEHRDNQDCKTISFSYQYWIKTEVLIFFRGRILFSKSQLRLGDLFAFRKKTITKYQSFKALYNW